LEFPHLKEACLKLIEQDESFKANRFLQMVLLDFALAEKQKLQALQILEHLKHIDKIRENYYQWRINMLKKAD